MRRVIRTIWHLSNEPGVVGFQTLVVLVVALLFGAGLVLWGNANWFVIPFAIVLVAAAASLVSAVISLRR